MLGKQELFIYMIARFLSQVISNEEQNLTVTSEKTISVEGHEGMLFDGKMFQFDAEKDIDISSTLVTKFTLFLSILSLILSCYIVSHILHISLTF